MYNYLILSIYSSNGGGGPNMASIATLNEKIL